MIRSFSSGTLVILPNNLTGGTLKSAMAIGILLCLTAGPGRQLKRGVVSVPPHVQAIVLCDHIYRDDETGKYVLAGTFNRVYFRAFPGEYPRASIYLNLSDFSGRHSISFRFVNLSDGTTLDNSPDFELHHDDRREHHECIIELSSLEFPDPGRFSLEILYDGDLIGHADIEALPLPAPEYSDEE